MPDDDIKLKVQAGEHNAAIRQAKEEWKRLGLSIENVEKIATAFNTEGIKVIGVLRSLGGEVQRVETQLYTATGGMKAATTNLRSLGQETKSVAKDVKEFNISWRSIGRLVAIQLTHQAISQLTAAMRHGIAVATEFGIKISEVMTIDPSGSLRQRWANDIRALSDLWGTDLLDQTEAAYQSLSNQVVHSVDDFRKFGDAINRFAVTAVTSSANSVNLLTAALNSYHLNVSEADRVAAQFFKTIELGRVRAEEMAEHFGQISILASQLGVNLSELDAVISTLTIQGIKYSEAATQIRGIFIKLLKPTKEMKGLFEDLGVSSGEQAIQIYGLGKFLSILQERTQGSSTELAKLINRIRGLSGALALTGKGYETYLENLVKIQDAQETYADKTALVMESAAKRLKIETEQIKNYFIKDLGGSFIETLGKLTNNFQNLDVYIKSFVDTVKFALIPIAIAAAYAMRNLGKALAKSPWFAAIASATILYNILRHLATQGQRTAEELEAGFKRWEQTETRRIENIKKSFDKETDKYEETLRQRLQIYVKYAGEQTKLINDLVKKEIESFSDASGVIKEHIKSINEEIRKQTSVLEQNIKKLQQIVEVQQNKAGIAKRSLAATLFGFNLEAEPDLETKLVLIRQRMAELSDESVQLATPETIDAFNEVRQQITSLVKEYERVLKAQAQENKEEINFAVLKGETNRLYETELELRQKIADLAAKQAKDEQNKLDAQTKANKAVDAILDKYNEFKLDQVFKLTDAEEINKALEKQKDIIVTLGATQLRNNIIKIDTNELSKEYFKLLDLQDQLIKKGEIKKEKDTLIEHANALKDEVKNLKEAYEKRLQLSRLETTIERRVGIFQKVTANVGGLNFNLNGIRSYQDLSNRLEELKAQWVKRIGLDSGLTSFDEGLIIKARQLVMGLDTKTLTSSIASIQAAIAELIKLRSELQGTSFAGLQFTDIDSIKNAIAIRQQEIEQIEDNIQGLLDNNDLLWEVKESNVDLIDALDKLRRVLESKTGSFRGAGANFAHGGLVDSVPAMLTPGEFVMNAAATKYFYPQLLAMNRAIPFAEGGLVDVGGINITVNAASNPRATARAVATELNRGIRQGTVKLRS